MIFQLSFNQYPLKWIYILKLSIHEAITHLFTIFLLEVLKLTQYKSILNRYVVNSCEVIISKRQLKTIENKSNNGWTNSDWIFLNRFWSIECHEWLMERGGTVIFLCESQDSWIESAGYWASHSTSNGAQIIENWVSWDRLKRHSWACFSFFLLGPKQFPFPWKKSFFFFFFFLEMLWSSCWRINGLGNVFLDRAHWS